MDKYSFAKVLVLGLGYIGLPTAAVLASRRIEVVGVDVNPAVVETINCGRVQIVEPDLDIAVLGAVTGGYLRATITPEKADAFLIAVPTPFRGDCHEPDLSYVEAAARSIAPVLSRGNLVVIESTSPVGTTDQVARWLAEQRPDLSFPHQDGEGCDIHIAYCPERVLPGKVMRELLSNDRIIAGMTPECARRAKALYQIFVTGACLDSNPRTAELAKLAENSFRDVNIAFANELSLVCDKLDINVWELIDLANHHPRVNILQPGPGVGGHCIAVDPWFIVSSAPEQAHLIRTAREVNDSKPYWVVEKVKAEIGRVLMANPDKSASDLKIACYGISFKPDVDDVRESPALSITQILSADHPGLVLVVEPNVDIVSAGITGLRQVALDFALLQADVHVLLVSHKEFHGVVFPENTVSAVRV